MVVHFGSSTIRSFRCVENIKRTIVPTPACGTGSKNIVTLTHNPPDCALKLDRFDVFERI